MTIKLTIERKKRSSRFLVKSKTYRYTYTYRPNRARARARAKERDAHVASTCKLRVESFVTLCWTWIRRRIEFQSGKKKLRRKRKSEMNTWKSIKLKRTNKRSDVRCSVSMIEMRCSHFRLTRAFVIISFRSVNKTISLCRMGTIARSPSNPKMCCECRAHFRIRIELLS